MSKIKIYELAKEIGATSKEVMDFLAGKDMGVKSHMNSIEDTEANQVRNFFSRKGKEEKPAEKPVEKPVEKMPEKSEDAPKKKIVRVLRPQNTQKGARPGAKRQAGKPLNSQVRQVQANNGRPSKAAPVQRAETTVKPQEHTRPTAERPAAERPAAANPAAVRPAEEKPAVKKAEPAARMPEAREEAAVKAQPAVKPQPAAKPDGSKGGVHRQQEENRPRTFAERSRGDGRPQGDRQDRPGERSQGR